MLIQFYVENFLSFKDEVCLNMVPSKSRTKKAHIIVDKQGKVTEVLPLAIMYGANASGKSNLVKALRFLRRLVLRGTRQDEEIPVRPFLLDNETENKPARLECIFKRDGVLYTYGVVVSAEKIHEEWLFARYTAQESQLFVRKTEDDKTQVESGLRLSQSLKTEKQRGSKGFIQYVAQGTRPNQLFLTEALDKNMELLKPIRNWFRSIQIVGPQARYISLYKDLHADPEFVDFSSRHLKVADTGISGMSSEEHEVEVEKDTEDDSIKPRFPLPGRQYIVKEEAGKRKMFRIDIKTQHIRKDKSVIYFDLSRDESDGTQKFLNLLPILYKINKGNCVYIIDELDRSLHPHLSRLFIRLYLKNANKSHSQLIVTTHDTTLLDRKVLRRDEIWFMEKDRHGASGLSALSEYKMTEGQNFEIGYRSGRFGSIPIIRGEEALHRERVIHEK